jgi:hypothetical protein
MEETVSLSGSATEESNEVYPKKMMCYADAQLFGENDYGQGNI